MKSNLPQMFLASCLRWVVAVAALVCMSGTATAAQGIWQNSSDGDFNDPLNWQGGVIPGPTDSASYQAGFQATYTVTFSGAVTNDKVAISNDQIVTFQLNGNTYTASDDVLVFSGSLLTLDGAGLLETGTVNYQHGTIAVLNGGHVEADRVLLSGGGVDFLTIDGIGSNFSITQDVVLGFSSGSTPHHIIVSGGGGLSTAATTLGRTFDATVTSGAVWQADSLTIEGGAQLIVGLGGTVDVTSNIIVTDGDVGLLGGTISAEMLDFRDNQLTGFGAIDAKILGNVATVFTASGGDLSLGDASRLDGFVFDGEIHVNNHTVTLNALSYAGLGILTTIDGGTLNGANGISLGSGRAISGTGRVDGATATGNGSTILATGDLQIGDSSAFDGVDLSGKLIVGAHTVTLDDRNIAVLGSLTEIGSSGIDGVLVAPNGLLVEFGKNVVGFGTIDTPNNIATPLINNGTIAGNSGAEKLTLNGYVKGVGTLSNFIIAGTYSPGLSPAEVAVSDFELTDTSTLVMELGGLIPGSEYDVLNVTGDLLLDGTLEIALINGFTPSLGDSFTIMTFESATGDFDTYAGIDLGGGLTLESDLTAKALTLSVVPEPSALTLAALSLLGLLGFGRRRRQRAA